MFRTVGLNTALHGNGSCVALAPVQDERSQDINYIETVSQRNFYKKE
ncbi:hypothetical protein J7438_12870 [Thalassotalea sp. G20_0]|nr:hypothetical protein [Thalassotalea sp. G20_0]